MRLPALLRSVPPWGWAAAGGAAALGAWLVSSREPGDSGAWWPGEFGTEDPELGPVDPYADKELATECGPEQEGAKLLRLWGIARWGERDGSPRNITRACTTGKDEHQAGRAWDLMTRDRAHGDAIVADLLADDPHTGEPHALARRLGVMYLIWNRRMWRAYEQGGLPRGSWGEYTGPNPHVDHVHFSLSRAGGRGETSLYALIRREMGDVA